MNRSSLSYRLLSLAWAALACLIAGCSTLALRDRPLVPTGHEILVGPYTVYSNEPIPAEAASISSLRRLPGELEKALAIPLDPGKTPIEVYILDDQKSFAHFLNTYYHELPPRRAFFLAQGDRRVIYTYVNTRLDEDLRHEATHALLHSALPDTPLWLDEGLAEYFEKTTPSQGQNEEHLTRLHAEIRHGWTPDLARLESLRDVRQMTPRDYREAWAWVHFFLDESPETRALFTEYVRELRAQADPEPLSQKLDRSPRAGKTELIAHIRALARNDQHLARAPASSTLRLQNARSNAAPRGDSMPARRGILSTLGGLARDVASVFRPR